MKELLMDAEVLHNKSVIVSVTGNVEALEIGKLRAAIENALSISPRGFIIDFSAVDYIDSAGISALVYAYRKVTTAGGKLALVVVNSYVKKVLTITRLNALPGLFIYDDILNAESVLEAA